MLSLVGCHETVVGSLEPTERSCERTVIKPSRCQGAAISPRGDQVACLTSRDSLGRFTPSALRIIDTKTGLSRIALRDTLGFGLFNGLLWSPDDRSIILRTGARFLSKLDLASGFLELNFINETPVDRAYGLPTWSPQGDSLYYLASYDYELESRHAHGLRVASKNGDGVHWVMFESESLWTMATPVAFDRAGRRMAFAIYKERPDFPTTMCIANIDGTHLREIAEFYGDVERVFWIDNDRTIAFDFVRRECVGPFSTKHTWLMDAETGRMRRSPVDFGDPRVQFGFDPQFTPDQKKLAFIGLDERLGYGVLQTMNIDGSDRRSVYAPHVQTPLLFDPRDPQPNTGGRIVTHGRRLR